MAKYRKKPVVVDAFRMGIDERPDWFQDKVSANEIITYTAVANTENKRRGIVDREGKWCDIYTPEGVMHGEHGDYIIKGVNGEIYPCKPDVFAKTYDKLIEEKTVEERICAVCGEKVEAWDYWHKKGVGHGHGKCLEVPENLR